MIGSKGLVPCAKSDRNELSVTVSVYADMVQCQVTKPPLPGDALRHAQHGGGRQRITEFTRKSRLNMLRKLAMIEHCAKGHFITLTYPDKFPNDPACWKRDLAALRKRMRRQFWLAGGIWRLEIKRRKSGSNAGQLAPHFHLLMVGLDYPEAYLRLWLRAAWYEIAHDGDQYQGNAAVQVDEIRSRRHAIYYMSKYMTKDEDDVADIDGGETPYVGRYWGVFGNLAMAATLVMQIGLAELEGLRLMLMQELRLQNAAMARRLATYRYDSGLTLFRFGVQSCPDVENVWDTQIVRMLTYL